MSETISIMFDENGIAKEYDDTFDISIHCESEEEQNEVLEILNRRWIPVSERLPEENGCYLVTTRGTHNDIIDIAYYTKGIWHKANKIIAWMPLPEPYKVGDTDG